MFKYKYKDIKNCNCYNFGRFDVLFIIKVLLE